VTASLLEIVGRMRRTFAAGATTFELDVLDPDLGRGLHAGERLVVDGVEYVHRPFRVWVDLAERMRLRLKTPRPAAAPLVHLVFEPLSTRDPEAAPEQVERTDRTEKYGTASPFARISKHEDPSFVLDMADALERIALPAGARVLDLGVNTGDELALIVELWPALRDATLVGVDHSASAIAAARARFSGPSRGAARGPVGGPADANEGPRVELHVADLAPADALTSLGLGRFDLVLSIGTLQSPGIDDRDLLRRIVQDHLTPTGAVLLGIPNCRYVDGEVEYGTRMKNFTQPELGLLIKDVAFYRKYLQQHHRQVFVTGKHYVLVTAVATRAD
jgi:SAM-dependent methyltransferase